jgi:nucleotide-binding universal stress UspA family protein
MLPFNKILCPVDFSEPSLEGINKSVELADCFSADLVLLHVVSPLTSIPGASAPKGFHLPTVMQEIEASAKTALENLVSEKVTDKIDVRSMVVMGTPADEIVRMAEVGNVDLIVIATRGMTGWKGLVFGSVAEKVVRAASCYVMTVPAPPEENHV